ncbi:hypothetical protein [Ferrimonas marina]|uniref:Uncharacterized protein n=1 Tax=Ferrimonas marina TaxID=299255 RepID=A0A1M5U8L5_9GAMM|nr:hypothetical protein [Ferrimonas marina]SHH59289.1 hypothetical protein SAMN02745129_2453 [Ferrimonas marina]
MSKGFELDFDQALSVVMTRAGWVQGEDFKPGLVLGLNEMGVLCQKDLGPLTAHWVSQPVTTGVYRQRYRVVKTAAEAKAKP